MALTAQTGYILP